VRRALVLLVLLSLPFTFALTIDLRFPLKIYELALLGAGCVSLLTLSLSTVPAAARSSWPLAAFAAWSLAVLLLHAWLPPEGMSTAGFTSRFGPLGDGIAKICYFLLSVFGFLVVAQRARREPDRVVRLWLWGAFLATGYAWYLFLSSMAGIPPVLLPGIVDPPTFVFAGREVIRSGTFEEGNFFGLFLVASVAVALYAGRVRAALALSLTVLITFSTVNFAALILLWTVLFRDRLRGLSPVRRWLVVAGAVVGVVAFVGFLLVTEYIQTVVVGKLVGENAVSRLERVGFALTGLRMFLEHPVTGVGISQYGFFYERYEVFDLGLLSNFGGRKRIANNVYVELLAETGIVGFALFAAFLRQVWREARSAELRPLRIGLVAMLIVWNAFPSSTIMFIWAYFGLVMGLAARHRQEASATLPASAGSVRPPALAV
jgi:O-antigen ligase